MSDSLDKDPENEDAGQEEIESPVDGPPPDWMQTATSSSGSSFSADEAPDWLKNIRAGKGTETEGEETSGAKSAPEAESAGKAGGMSDLERLLAEEGIDLSGVEDERPEDATGMSVKDWMIATSDDEIIRKRVGAEPVEEVDLSAEPEPEPVESEPVAAVDDQDVVEEELPDWLREISDEVETSLPLGTAPEPVAEADEDQEDKMAVDEDLPDWLREVSEEVQTESPSTVPEPIIGVDEEDEVGEMIMGEDLPDWLQGVSDEPAEADELMVEARVPAEADEEEMPDWFEEVSDEPVEADEQMVEAPVPAEADEEEMPDWFEEVSDEPAEVDELMVEVPVPAEADEEEMPDWFEETSEETIHEVVTSTTDDDKFVVSDELPSWLREVETEPEELLSTFEEVLREPAVSEVAESATEDELPDWLQEAEVESVAEEALGPEFETAPPSYSLTDSTDTIDEENLPDWLRDVQEDEAETVSEFVPAEIVADEDDSDLDEGDLPDWLKEAQEEDILVEPEAEPARSIAPDITPTATEEVYEDELPGWLQEVQDEPAQATFEIEAVAEVTEEEEEVTVKEDLPDWLQEVQIAEEPFEPSEPSPDELFAAAADEQDVVEGEDLPEWLQEVQQEELELSPVEEVVAAVSEPIAEEDSIREEELPDWLQVEEESERELEAEPVAALLEPEPVVSEAGVPGAEVSVEPEPETVESEPAETPPAPVSDEVATAVEAAPTSKTISDMPHWLKKLREGDVEDAEAVPVKPLPKPKPAAVEPITAVGSEPKLASEPEVESEAELPEEAGERLGLARTARDAGNLAEAVQFYESLVSSGVHLDQVIEDIQQTVKSYPANASLYQVMGDAMMKEGRLQSALDAYRQALTKL